MSPVMLSAGSPAANRLRMLALTLTVLLALIAAAPVSAGARSFYKDQYFFKATISGTYVAHGTQVDSGCYEYLADGLTPSPITVTTIADETLHFKSTRPVGLVVDRAFDNSVQAGTLGRVTPVLVTTTKTRVDSAPCQPGDEQPTCGTRTMHFGISLISLLPPPLRLVYDISDGPGQVIFPDDPFGGSCSVPTVPWWGKLSAPAAQMPKAKLFNRRLRSFTIHAALGKSRSDSTPGFSENGRYDLNYVVTLVRAGR
jgi:hypothetical protein